MIDKLNKIFAYLASQYYGVYVLLGIMASFLFVHNVEVEAQIPILKILIYPAILIVIVRGILMQSFYEKSERGGRKVPLSRYGYVIKDDYFFVKINSDIGINKKITGYLYVLFRVMDSSLHGFVIGLALFMWLTRGS